MGFKLNLLGVFILFTSFVLFQIINKGPRLNFECSVFNYNCPNLNDIQLSKGSTYDKKFEKLVEEFKTLFATGNEIGAQLSVYYKNKNVVNIGSGKRDIEKDLPHELDTLDMVYSTSKSMCFFVIAMLVDRGLLKYEERIQHYWPEFGVKDKHEVTVEGNNI